MTEQLTRRQRAIFDFIVSYTDINLRPPTQRLIQEHFKLKSANAIWKHVDALRRKRAFQTVSRQTIRTILTSYYYKTN